VILDLVTVVELRLATDEWTCGQIYNESTMC